MKNETCAGCEQGWHVWRGKKGTWLHSDHTGNRGMVCYIRNAEGGREIPEWVKDFWAWVTAFAVVLGYATVWLAIAHHAYGRAIVLALIFVALWWSALSNTIGAGNRNRRIWFSWRKRAIGVGSWFFIQHVGGVKFRGAYRA